MPLTRNALVLTVLLPLAAFAQTATVSVDVTSTLRTVDERVFGINATMWDPYASSDETIALLNEAGVRTIRLPGGSQSNQYHWRVNRMEGQTWNWQTGFDDFMRLRDGLNANVFVSVNYGTGTPEEAAAWVAYANAATTASGNAVNVTIGVDAKGYDWKTASYWADLRASSPLPVDDEMNFLRLGRTAPFGVKDWEIGNENYGLWEHDERPVGETHNAFVYATRAREYIAKMKAVDPTIRTGVVALPNEIDYHNGYTAHPATNPRTGAVRNGWTPVMLATLKSLGLTPDALVYHRYDQAPAVDSPNNPESDAKLLQSSSTWPDDAAAFRQMLIDYLGATEAAKVELVVTENNSVYSSPGKQTTSLVNALFYADSIGHVLQTEFNAVTWWALRNGRPASGMNNSASLYGWRDYGDYGIFASPTDAAFEAGFYEAHPTYYGFKQLGNFARHGDTVVAATSTNTLLRAFAAQRAEGGLSVLVINKDPTNAITGTFAFTGFTPEAVAKRHVYGKPQDEAARLGTGSQDVTTIDTAVNAAPYATSFPSYSLTVLTFEPMAAAKAAGAAFARSAVPAVEAGGSATFTASSLATGALTHQWQRNGRVLAGETTSSLVVANIQPVDTGLYRAVVTASAGSGTSEPVILGVATASKVIGLGEELQPINITHPNGKVFDQVLMKGVAATITSDHALGQVTRMSFVDSNNDIVQVEFAGAGTLSLVLDDFSGPARPVNYNQAIDYVKGHVGIVIIGADETTNVSVFTVGRATAFDPTGGFNFLLPISEANNPVNNGNQLFVGHGTTNYDGRADVSFIAISSVGGKFGGVRASNAVFSASQGLTGIYAPGVEFMGPVFVGDIDASGTATPVLVIGSSADTRVTGGDLAQANGAAVQVAGLTQLKFTAGGDSHGNPSSAKTNLAVLKRNGTDVTAAIVVQ